MPDRRLLTPTARAALDAASAGLDEALAPLAARDAELFRLRLERWFQNLLDGLEPVYGHRPDFPAFLNRQVRAAHARAVLS